MQKGVADAMIEAEYSFDEYDQQGCTPLPLPDTAK